MWLQLEKTVCYYNRLELFNTMTKKKSLESADISQRAA